MYYTILVKEVSIIITVSDILLTVIISQNTLAHCTKAFSGALSRRGRYLCQDGLERLEGSFVPH